MIWTVTYRQSAENELTELWLASSAKDELARAANDVERRLRTDPLSAGQELAGVYRIIVEGPVAFLYKIYEQDYRISVTAVFLWTTESD